MTLRNDAVEVFDLVDEAKKVLHKKWDKVTGFKSTGEVNWAQKGANRKSVEDRCPPSPTSGVLGAPGTQNHPPLA